MRVVSSLYNLIDFHHTYWPLFDSVPAVSAINTFSVWIRRKLDVLKSISVPSAAVRQVRKARLMRFNVLTEGSK